MKILYLILGTMTLNIFFLYTNEKLSKNDIENFRKKFNIKLDLQLNQLEKLSKNEIKKFRTNFKTNFKLQLNKLEKIPDIKTFSLTITKFFEDSRDTYDNNLVNILYEYLLVKYYYNFRSQIKKQTLFLIKNNPNFSKEIQTFSMALATKKFFNKTYKNYEHKNFMEDILNSSIDPHSQEYQDLNQYLIENRYYINFTYLLDESITNFIRANPFNLNGINEEDQEMIKEIDGLFTLFFIQTNEIFQYIINNFNKLYKSKDIASIKTIMIFFFDLLEKLFNNYIYIKLFASFVPFFISEQGYINREFINDINTNPHKKNNFIYQFHGIRFEYNPTDDKNPIIQDEYIRIFIMHYYTYIGFSIGFSKHHKEDYVRINVNSVKNLKNALSSKELFHNKEINKKQSINDLLNGNQEIIIKNLENIEILLRLIKEYNKKNKKQ